MEPDAIQRYLDARVENPSPFIAGVQCALDKMLAELDRMSMGLHTTTIEHLVATGILEKAKRGEL